MHNAKASNSQCRDKSKEDSFLVDDIFTVHREEVWDEKSRVVHLVWIILSTSSRRPKRDSEDDEGRELD